MMFVR